MSDHSLKIGDIFTPKESVDFAINQFGIFDDWLAGKTIFDPTCGDGNLLFFLVEHGLDKGYSLQDLPLNNLYGNELNLSYHQKAVDRFQAAFSYDISQQISNRDIFKIETEKKYDVIFGNPPWQNFVDLPENYKTFIKPFFKKYQLIAKGKSTLLGNSRVDICALVIKKVITDHLIANGKGYFFLPLSLFLNDGAHAVFRQMSMPNDEYFAVNRIFDFKGIKAFDGIATRYGLAEFERNKTQEHPISYSIFDGGNWIEKIVSPLFHPTDPYNILEEEDYKHLKSFEKIKIPKKSFPRQGVNTCGANSIFFFDTCEEHDENHYLLNEKIVLPKQYVFPLITSKNFQSGQDQPQKWVLLPYNTNGKPIEPSQLSTTDKLDTYLNQHRETLSKRKGTMIGGWLKRGYWWACLGVGPYNYAPYKIVWQAYGKKVFHPQMFMGEWQVNQSLQAYIPCWSKEQAEEIYEKLKHPFVERYLQSLRMEGTMNWAQPGKMKKLLEEETNNLTLF